MKKSLVALAALAAVGAASAQSSVTLYGVVDVNVQYAKGSTSLTSMESGGLNGSRWGLRGTEDLGGGLNGIFRLEGGFNTDTGAMGQGNSAAAAGSFSTSTTAGTFSRLFGRHATVGLSGGFGSVRLGRNLTPLATLTDDAGSLGSKGVDLSAIARTMGNVLYRVDNSITYDSPNLGGFSFQGQFSLAADGAEQVNHAGRNAGLRVGYAAGPLTASVAYATARAVTPISTGAPAAVTAIHAAPRVKGIAALVGYNFGVASVKGMFERDDNNTAEDPTFIGLDVSVPFGAFTGSFGIARSKDNTGAAAVSDDVKLYTVQGVYNLSKRTALYSFYTHVGNDRGSNRGFRSPALGQNNRAFQVGVRHFF